MMSFLKASGMRSRISRAALAAGLCVLLGCLSGVILDKAEASGVDKKVPPDKCANITVGAQLRDFETDAIRSDFGYNPALEYSEYRGWEDCLACIMETQDNDFILGTTSTRFEKTGIDRKVLLNFAAVSGNPVPPFNPLQLVEVLVRADYILSEDPYGTEEQPEPKRLVLWFTVGRTDYKLFFDGDGCDWVMAYQTGVAPNRVWTLECDGWGRLEGGRKTPPSYYRMPFRITIRETEYPKTCL